MNDIRDSIIEETNNHKAQIHTHINDHKAGLRDKWPDQETDEAHILSFEPTDDLLRLKGVKHYLVNAFFFSREWSKEAKVTRQTKLYLL